MTNERSIGSRIRALGLSFVFVSLSAGIVSAGGDPLRVCSDPANLPYSNEKQEGFENKIAELVAAELGRPLAYFWWPAQRGLVKNTLNAGNCDLLVGIPKGYDPVTWTKPYYRSSYVLAYRAAAGPKVTSLADPALKSLRIGVHTGSPAEAALAQRELSDRLRGYRLFFDPRLSDSTLGPMRILDDLSAGEIDVAAVWGPFAGTYSKKHGDSLGIAPLDDNGPQPLTYEFSMGVKKGNRELKTALDAVIAKRQADIEKLLAAEGVPLLPLKPAEAPDAAKKTSATTGDAHGKQ